jgi:hypothetical protein
MVETGGWEVRSICVVIKPPLVMKLVAVVNVVGGGVDRKNDPFEGDSRAEGAGGDAELDAPGGGGALVLEVEVAQEVVNVVWVGNVTTDGIVRMTWSDSRKVVVSP